MGDLVSTIDQESNFAPEVMVIIIEQLCELFIQARPKTLHESFQLVWSRITAATKPTRAKRGS